MKIKNTYYDSKVIIARYPIPLWWTEKGKSVKQWCRRILAQQRADRRDARALKYRIACAKKVELLAKLDVEELIQSQPKKKWWWRK